MNILAPNRICPECSAPFKATHGRQAFCTGAHQRAFHDRDRVRGLALVPLLQAWRAARGRGKASEIGKYAFAQLCALTDIYNAEDKAAGRNPSHLIATRRREGWAAADLAA